VVKCQFIDFIAIAYNRCFYLDKLVSAVADRPHNARPITSMLSVGLRRVCCACELYEVLQTADSRRHY